MKKHIHSLTLMFAVLAVATSAQADFCNAAVVKQAGITGMLDKNTKCSCVKVASKTGINPNACKIEKKGQDTKFVDRKGTAYKNVKDVNGSDAFAGDQMCAKACISK